MSSLYFVTLKCNGNVINIVATSDYIGSQVRGKEHGSLFSRTLCSKSVLRTGVNGRVEVDLLLFTTTREDLGQVSRLTRYTWV